ncbi:F-box and associated interaction domains-containing protein, putative [Theobroma cacao]|uniref:F-box and associated interaction domains-containing protein, putative n=1 Tax=Theobroma cacao TaxID=3641 RepID=A0A061DMQ5_THECC|nr:F-box and associated interaction domains-containing protein, putative [Theobroma cacao]
MERLPQEIVVDILSRLPIPSLVQSKSVCRAWRSLIRDLVLVNKHIWRMIQNDPSFILQSYNPMQNQLYFGDFSSQNDGNVIMKKLAIPPLPKFHVVGSCNGLLCLHTSQQSFEICIYNPFTRDYTELPKLTEHPRYNVGVRGFGFDLTTKEYKVVKISYQIRTCGGSFPRIARSTNSIIRAPVTSPDPIEAVVHILTLGSPTWRNLGTVPFHLMTSQQSQVLINGKLHWVAYPNRNEKNNPIISFDLATEQFQEVPRPDCISLSGRRFEQLVALRGCLSSASYHDDNERLEIWVMKEYNVKESWSKEFSIGAYVPPILQQDDTFNNSRFYMYKKCMRVLWQLRSGEILFECRNKALVLYDPHCRTFKDLHLTFEGISKYFKVVVHVASLNWINTFINT